MPGSALRAAEAPETYRDLTSTNRSVPKAYIASSQFWSEHERNRAEVRFDTDLVSFISQRPVTVNLTQHIRPLHGEGTCVVLANYAANLSGATVLSPTDEGANTRQWRVVWTAALPTSVARSEIEKLRTLSPDWNDKSPTPNERAFELVNRVFDVIDAICESRPEIRIVPDRIIPDPEGGVSIYFFSRLTRPGARRRYARLNCSNTGEIVALVHDRQNRPEAWAVGQDGPSLFSALDRIHRFTES